MKTRYVYWIGALLFLGRAAYDWFGRHNGVDALGEILAGVLGLFFFWLGTYIWNAILTAFYGKKDGKGARHL